MTGSPWYHGIMLILMMIGLMVGVDVSKQAALLESDNLLNVTTMTVPTEGSSHQTGNITVILPINCKNSKVNIAKPRKSLFSHL